jgi:oxygen-independent coproporphyrinogen-3 oxidase
MSFGVYIHFPYCLSKCPYCDFASRAEKVIPQESYTEAVLRELRARSVEFPDREAISIYFGGGTPSLWDPRQLGRVLEEARSLWRVRPDAEVTLEANPGTTDEERFSAFRRLGVNRLSIGVQSFAPAQLVSLGRKHSPHDAVRAFETARKAGFENVSLDLIHGAEGQTPQLAARDAAAAVALSPEHISCYALTLVGLAEDVPMAKAVRRGELRLPDDEAQEEMGFEVRGELQRGGYARYEISNYAQPGFEAVHNSLYWRGGEYVAVGCGASGFSKASPEASSEASGLGPQASGNSFLGRRYTNDRSPERYMERVEATGLGEASFEKIDAEQHLRERIFTGLRLAEGIDMAELSQDLGIPVRDRYAAQIERIVREDLGTLQGGVLRLNERGLDLHTEVSLRFF